MTDATEEWLRENRRWDVIRAMDDHDAARALLPLFAAARRAGMEEAAAIAESFVDYYPEDVFLPEGTSVDAQSARVIRGAAPAIAYEIRAAIDPKEKN